jgi:cell division protein FtsI (penicillin-binding protein 3)
VARLIDHSRFEAKQISVMQMGVNKTVYVAKNRLFIACICFCFSLTAIFVRLIDLMIVRPNDSCETFIAEAPRSTAFLGRAEITDRNGQVLATTLITSSLFLNGKKVLDPIETVDKLLTVFPNLDRRGLLKKINDGKTFVWLHRHLTPEQQKDVINLGLPGVEFVRDHRRIYPQGNIVSHVLGYTDIDNNGIAGIEKSQDDFLKQCGSPLVLSLDLRVQHILRDELLKSISEFSCMGASGMIIDMQTGEVLSMVSLPDFNPNKIEKINEDQRFNKNTLGIYEMGSIMKIPNTAMGLDCGAVNLSTKFNTSEPLKVGHFNITDYRADYGVINVAEIFVHSSNKGSAKIALKAGSNAQREFLSKVGLLDPLKIELPEVGKPMKPKRWREATAITISYGYGLSVSPAQILYAIASIVGGGNLLQPTILYRKDHPETKRIVSEEISKQMLQLARDVVLYGTATKAGVEGYFVGGKTGTANMLIRGHYDKQRVSTTFVGVFGESAKNVRYAILIRLDDPQRLKKTYGFNNAGWNAAPTAKNVIERVTHVLGMLPQCDPHEILDPFFRNASYAKGAH